MSADALFQNALLAGLRTSLAGRVNGVSLGPPVQAAPPWIELGELLAADWSTKDRAGRELRCLMLIRDDRAAPERVQAIADAAEAVIAALDPAPGAWRVASLVLVRRRLARERPGWLVALDHRVRLLAV